MLSAFICHDYSSIEPGYVLFGASVSVLFDAKKYRVGANLTCAHQDDFTAEVFGDSRLLPGQVRVLEKALPPQFQLIEIDSDPLQRTPDFQCFCKSRYD